MKNVLYIGPYKDSNGYGYSSRRYIEALSSNNDINLSIRPLFTNNSSVKYPLSLDHLAEYEENSSKSYDAVIQHCSPDHVVYNKKFHKNICLTQIETRSLKRSGWINKLNMMDEVVVGSTFGESSLLDSGVTTDIRVSPEPYNIDNFTKVREPFFSFDSIDTKPFIFYTIGQYNEKKNIKSIILAYLLEFTKKDNVRLFIKTGDHEIGPTELEDIIKYDMAKIKHGIRKNTSSYPDIDIITGLLSDEDIIRLHQSGDCYINAVKADDNCSCSIEACLSNSLLITTNNCGTSTYFNSGSALFVNSMETGVFSTDNFDINQYTINQTWLEPEIHSLCLKMRQALWLESYKRLEMQNLFNNTVFDHTIAGRSII